MSEPPRGMPMACGAVGDFDPEVLTDIALRQGVELRPVHSEPGAALMLDRDPIRWSGPDQQGVGWPERHPTRASAARSWQEAASAGACGLVASGGGRHALHASASGVAPLYCIRRGAAVYFATEIDALVWAQPEALRPDWTSWASILVLGFVPGAGTPIEGVRRVPPQALIEAGRTVADPHGDLAWRDADPGDPAEIPERILAGLRAEVAASPQGPLICPLSGGFDSRLLACLLAELRPADVTTWTVNIDQGNEREESLAGAVAAELGLPHRVVEQPTPPFGVELAEAAGRVDYESLLHLEMGRLATGLPAEGLVADGLAGDVLIKGLFLDREIVEAPNSHVAVGRAFDRLVSADLGEALFAPTTWRGLRGSACEAFCAEGQRFDGHPSAASLTLYWTRTRRGVGTSPARTLAAAHPVAMPFLADDVARAALQAPLASKLGGALYREVLELANPRVAALPSTNDQLPPAPRTRRPVKRSPEARRAYLDLLERSPLRPWFGDRLETAIGSGKLGDVLSSTWLLPRLQYLCAFTLWAERYADRITALEPDGPFGGAPR